MENRYSGLAAFAAFLTSIVLDALVFPAAEEGYTRAPNSPTAHAVAGGVIRWLVRLLLVPVEVVAQIMTLLGIVCVIYYVVVFCVGVLVYVIIATWAFMADGTVSNPKPLVDFISNLR